MGCSIPLDHWPWEGDCVQDRWRHPPPPALSYPCLSVKGWAQTALGGQGRLGLGPFPGRQPGPTARPLSSLGLRTMGQCEPAWASEVSQAPVGPA